MPLDGKPGFGAFHTRRQTPDHLAGGVVMTAEMQYGHITVRIRIGDVTIAVTVKHP